MVGETFSRIDQFPVSEAEQMGQGDQAAGRRHVLCGQILRLMGDGLECSRCGQCLKAIGDELDLIYSLTKLLAEAEALQPIPQLAS